MKIFVLLGSFNAFLSIALGAFGAHGLKGKISPELLKVWDTAVFYHIVHALGLLLVGILCQQLPQIAMLRWAGWALLIGVLLFSGSLYLMALLDVRPLGVVTPLGGVAFLVGWLLVFLAVLKA